MGPRAHVGLAVRLPRARSLRRLPRPVAGPLRRRRHRAVPRGDAEPDPRRVCGPVRRGSGSTPAFRPPALGRPRQPEPAGQARPRRPPARAAARALPTTATRALAPAPGAPAALGRAQRPRRRRTSSDHAARDRVQQGQRRGRRARPHRAGDRRRPHVVRRSVLEAGHASCCARTPAPPRCCSPRPAPPALEMSALLLDLQPGDTVIVPSFTFVSSAVAFVRAGAGDQVLRHRAADPRARPAPRRRAARRHGPRDRGRPLRRASSATWTACARCWRTGPTSAIIEDNAHGLFGRWRGQPLGSLGRFATLSFHETKNFVCGEGGALVLNDAGGRRPGLGALRQGHEPQGVLPGPGRQVLLAGHRLVLRALRRARGVPARAAGAARRHPGQAPRACTSGTSSCWRRTRPRWA